MMKKLLTVLVLAACAAAPAMADNRVRTLGVTQLGHREGDLQMLDVQCRPRVASIKLRASRGSAELERVFVTYGNGERESLPVRRYLDRGQETRWLDLTGQTYKSMERKSEQRFVERPRGPDAAPVFRVRMTYEVGTVRTA